MIKVVGTDHVAFEVPNLGLAVRFFMEMFGYSPAGMIQEDSGYKWVFMKHPQAQIVQLTCPPLERRSPAIYDALTEAHLAFRVEDGLVDALAEVEGWCLRNQVSLSPEPVDGKLILHIGILSTSIELMPAD